jgi:hypothetical protein
MQDEVEIIRWAGIWKVGQEVRVGARLSDGRDALLVAFLGDGSPEPTVRYSLVIQGEDHQDEFVIPSELERKIEERLLQNHQKPGSRTLKDLKLF